MNRNFVCIFSFSLCFLVSLTTNAQLGRIVNKVKNQAVDKVLGNSDQTQQVNEKTVKKEPDCACTDAKTILEFTENIKVDYSEYSFSVTDDGKILLIDKLEGKYYIVKDGIKKGPYTDMDPEVRQFDIPDKNYNSEQKTEELMAQYKGIIVPAGEKYLIKFNGKTYGPFTIISSFSQNQSKTKFAAMVIQDVIMNEATGKSMEERMKNAKTDQERMALSMEMSQQLQQKMMANGGSMEMSPKLVSNIPGAKYDMSMQGSFSSKVKYDEIVFMGYDKIMDLTGKILIKLDPAKVNASDGLWLSSDNSQIAAFDHGTLNIGEDKVCNEVFCPYVSKMDGKVFLTFMYFSPLHNAIMQCKVPF